MALLEDAAAPRALRPAPEHRSGDAARDDDAPSEAMAAQLSPETLYSRSLWSVMRA